MKRLKLFILCFGILLHSFFVQSANPPKHEMRAVWLTTVYGLDWPHFYAKNESSRMAQQQKICEILDRLQEANFNVVFLQARLRGDVIWRSAIEPASKVFSGKYGVMPGYDPLAFVIEECHKRGMECHAWFVTFPLGKDKMVREQGRLSVVKKHPELCKHHQGEWYLDPGVPGTTNYILSLVKEVVTYYDIDGIHFDYVRYPENATKFPDKNQFRKSGASSLAEWRRKNINKMMTRIYDLVKGLKPWVQVSSSPLGKYSRIPRVPNAGWTAYESVYQDPKEWFEAGKQDLILPMMYYLHDNFFPFVDNWVENSNHRLVVPGLGAYRLMKEEGDWELTDLTDQIDYSRYYGAAGCAFFRGENILENVKGLFDELKGNYYKYPAMLPPLPWLDDTIPSSPKEIEVELKGHELCLTWQKPAEENQDLTYTVYCTRTDSIDTSLAENILITGIRDTMIYLPVDTVREQQFSFSVSASTRFHIEGKPSRETYYYLSRYKK